MSIDQIAHYGLRNGGVCLCFEGYEFGGNFNQPGPGTHQVGLSLQFEPWFLDWANEQAGFWPEGSD